MIINPFILILPFASFLSIGDPPLFLQNINLNDGTTVLGGLAVGGILFGCAKLFSYIKNRYDTSIKTSYDIDTLFKNYAEMEKAVDDGNDKNNEIIRKLDKGSLKIDKMITDNKQTRFLIQELSKMVYDHDEILYERRRYKSNNTPYIRRRISQQDRFLDENDNDDENNDDN